MFDSILDMIMGLAVGVIIARLVQGWKIIKQYIMQMESDRFELIKRSQEPQPEKPPRGKAKLSNAGNEQTVTQSPLASSHDFQGPTTRRKSRRKCTRRASERHLQENIRHSIDPNIRRSISLPSPSKAEKANSVRGSRIIAGQIVTPTRFRTPMGSRYLRVNTVCGGSREAATEDDLQPGGSKLVFGLRDSGHWAQPRLSEEESLHEENEESQMEDSETDPSNLLQLPRQVRKGSSLPVDSSPSHSDFVVIPDDPYSLTWSSGEQSISSDPYHCQKLTRTMSLSRRLKLIFGRRHRYSESVVKPSDIRISGPEEYTIVEDSQGYIGTVIIFNHRNFSVKHEVEREGTEHDCDRLQKTLELLKLKVTVMHDLEHRGIISHLLSVSKEMSSEGSSVSLFGCVFLTHGDDLGHLAARDRNYHINEVWEPFTPSRCPGLSGVPKFFLFQACRGTNRDMRIQTDSNPFQSRVQSRLPEASDFLFAYSTVEGHVAYRETDKGSPYIQRLCDVLLSDVVKRKKCDLIDVLTITSRLMSHYEVKSTTPTNDVVTEKQCPSFTSTLTKKLRLF